MGGFAGALILNNGDTRTLLTVAGMLTIINAALVQVLLRPLWRKHRASLTPHAATTQVV